MSSGVRNHDILASHDLADIVEDSLRFHRERIIIRIGLMFRDHSRTDRKRFLRLTVASRSSRNLVQRIRNISDNLDIRLIYLVDVCRTHVHMDNLCLALRIPFCRGKFDNVVTDCDDEICLLKNLVLIVSLRNPDCPHRVWIIKRNHTLCHHRVDNRNFQLGSKLRELF